MEKLARLNIRRYGHAGPMVMVLHGGPGATGTAAVLARELSDTFTVIEPWQRGSAADISLTVAQHIEDLHAVVQSVGTDRPPILIG